jgi:hypothetical protein
MLDALQLMVDLSFWWASPHSRSALQHLLSSGGHVASADALARSLGLRNRHQLAYVLRKDGLPPLAMLAAWVKLAIWTMEWESNGRSLCALSLDQERDPAYRYRLVKRLTGLGWVEVRQRGVVWVLARWLDACERCQADEALTPAKSQRASSGAL